MSNVLQPLLAGSAIALSVFSLMIYLWLGLTVLLMGDRRSKVTWIGGVGLLLAALFFLCHGAMVGAGVPAGASATDFWWHLAWVPGFAAPLFWAAIGMHYAGLTGYLRRLRLPALIVVASLGGVSAVLALLNWSAIRIYGDFIRMLSSLLRLRSSVESLPEGTASALSILGLSFVVYMAACACLPWASLVARRRLSPPASSRQGGGTLLWDATDAWSRARPALLAASICMLGAGGVAALIGIGASVVEHNALRKNVAAGLSGLQAPSTLPGHMPLVLVAADLAVQFALAGLGLAVGWAVVRQGILVERRLPQRDFLSRWRGTTLVAGLLAVVVAGMAAVIPVALPELLVLVTIVTATYALFTWEAYGEHDRMLAQLRPFISSLSVGHVGWLNGDPRETERSVEALFTSLCRDVLGATRGRLTVAAGRLHHTFTYEPSAQVEPSLQDGREWTLPVSDERGVVAQLALGPRADGAGYTTGDLEMARACGQRILDAMGEFAAAQAVASLARRRGLEAELSAALPRRVLHDEVLPRLHLAMLRLEKLKSRVVRATGVAVGAALPSIDIRDAEAEDVRAELADVVRDLATTHHDLALLMRQSPAANPRRIEHGFVGALRSSLDGEFKGTFDSLEWDAPAEAGTVADTLPAITADLLLGAALEAIRNAGRHARGSDLHRRLHLHVALAADEQWAFVMVSDDGVGLQNEATRGAKDDLPDESVAGRISTGGGTRTGLLTHGALLALVGGSLTVRSQAEAGTIVTVRVPRGNE